MQIRGWEGVKTNIFVDVLNGWPLTDFWFCNDNCRLCWLCVKMFCCFVSDVVAEVSKYFRPHICCSSVLYLFIKSSLTVWGGILSLQRNLSHLCHHADCGLPVPPMNLLFMFTTWRSLCQMVTWRELIFVLHDLSCLAIKYSSPV